jgi:hypothetical protein
MRAGREGDLVNEGKLVETREMLVFGVQGYGWGQISAIADFHEWKRCDLLREDV